MCGTLTKADLITVIHTENGYSLKQSADIVETLLESIKQAMESGEDVMISGFGKFEVKDKQERKGRNPVTGNDMILPGKESAYVQVCWQNVCRPTISDSAPRRLPPLNLNSY